MNQTMAAPLDVRLMNATATALFIAFAGLMLWAAIAWVGRSPVFAITGITVTGDLNHTSAKALRANMASKLSGTFLTVDLERARQVFEAVPWVRRAVVKRDFPNRLRVTLQEHRAVAYWGADGESRLLNSFGEIFEANVGEVEPEILARLMGPDGQSAQVLAMYQALQSLFEGMDLSAEQFELTARDGWRVRLENGAMVELGRGSTEEVMARTARFLKTVSRVTANYGRKPDALESADLRHEDGYAIRLRGVTTNELPLKQKQK